jgi:hypothetical protein
MMDDVLPYQIPDTYFLKDGALQFQNFYVDLHNCHPRFSTRLSQT